MQKKVKQKKDNSQIASFRANLPIGLHDKLYTYSKNSGRTIIHIVISGIIKELTANGIEVDYTR